MGNDEKKKARSTRSKIAENLEKSSKKLLQKLKIKKKFDLRSGCNRGRGSQSARYFCAVIYQQV